MIIPCIKNKCLKYPTCKYKSYVECSPLHEYYLSLTPPYSHNKRSRDNKIAWMILKTDLPELTGIFRDKQATQFEV